MTNDVNTNTFQRYDGTEGTSFCPTGQRKCIHLFLFSKQENMNKNGRYSKRKLKKSHTTRLSTLSFFSASFVYDTMSRHTPMM